MNTDGEAEGVAQRRGAEQIASLVKAMQKLEPTASLVELQNQASILCIQVSLMHSSLLPASRRGTVPGLKALLKAHKALFSAFSAIRDFQSDEILALRDVTNSRAPHADLLRAVASINDSIVAAHHRLSAGPARPPRGRGKPPDYIAVGATNAARDTYQRLTGKRARRKINSNDGAPYDDFYLFLGEVFSILEIGASAEHHIRRMEDIRSKA